MTVVHLSAVQYEEPAGVRGMTLAIVPVQNVATQALFRVCALMTLIRKLMMLMSGYCFPRTVHASKPFSLTVPV